MHPRRARALARFVVGAVLTALAVGVPLFALLWSGPELATLVVAAMTFLVAVATLYLHVRDRRPRLHVGVDNTKFARDGRVIGRASDFARRRFFLHNDGTKPVKIEDVRVEFESGGSGDFPATGMFLEVDTDAGLDIPVQPRIPGWLEPWQTVSFTADLGQVERFLSRQGHSGPTKVRLVVTDALGHDHGRYFTVLARSEEGPMSKMRRLLVDKLGDRLSETTPMGAVHVDRREIEGWGAEIGLNPDETAQLFEDLEGVAWRGEYVRSLDGRWTGVRMRHVR